MTLGVVKQRSASLSIQRKSSNFRGATGAKKSEDSAMLSQKKQTTFKVQVSKIEIGQCFRGNDMAICHHHPRLLYDAEEGFTIINKPQDEGFLQQVKETLTEK